MFLSRRNDRQIFESNCTYRKLHAFVRFFHLGTSKNAKNQRFFQKNICSYRKNTCFWAFFFPKCGRFWTWKIKKKRKKLFARTVKHTVLRSWEAWNTAHGDENDPSLTARSVNYTLSWLFSSKSIEFSRKNRKSNCTYRKLHAFVSFFRLDFHKTL